MKKLRTGDEVIVVSGKDSGKTGTLSKFISETKCIVSGVKIVKKHQKPNPQLNIQGGILEKEVPNLNESLGFKSNMAVPKITKVTLNMGLGPDAVNDRKVIDTAIEDLRLISGQQPVKTLVRKSVASFKIRDGYPIGCKVTLRGERMYDFLDRLLNVAIPRERDFRGLSVKSFDGQGNYTMGIKEHIIFPEIDYDKVQKIRGMDISITTSARNDEEGLSLLKELNFPFVS